MRKGWLVAMIVLAGCGHGAARGTGLAPTTTTTRALPATTTTSTTAPIPVLGAASPADAASHLIGAWKAGDRAGALTEADAGAVAALFAQPYPAGGPQARNCDENPSSSNCFFRIGDNGLNIHAVRTPVGWRVDAAQFVQ